jgi:hypothetical protein
VTPLSQRLTAERAEITEIRLFANRYLSLRSPRLQKKPVSENASVEIDIGTDDGA